MNLYQLPTWSYSASQSLGLHYRPLQDIEIYVEDIGAEAIYMELLSRAVNHSVKIKKVVCLGGRENVVAHCKQYNENFPALFIIDGDLDLLVGEREQTEKRLFQHRLYCLENYLFCQNASAELLRDKSGKLQKFEASEALEWDIFINDLTSPMLKLFKVYAVSWKVLSENRTKTVSRKYHNFCRKVSNARGHVICDEKIQKVIEEIKSEIFEAVSESKYLEIYDIVSQAIDNLENPLFAVSGKDYLLKALRDYLAYKGASYNLDDGFKFRLARYCDVAPLAELAEAIYYTISQGPYEQRA